MSYTIQRHPSTKLKQSKPYTKLKPYKSLLANRNMYTFTNTISNDLAYEQIMAFTENFKHAPLQKASALQEELRNTLPQEPTFGYVMYPPIRLTDADVVNAMRYNDSSDIHFAHFTVWYEVAFVFLDFHAKQIMCWGTKQNVQDALEGIQELLNNAIHKKEHMQTQAQHMQIQAQQTQQAQHMQTQVQKRLEDDDDRMDCWDKNFMANKHI